MLIPGASKFYLVWTFAKHGSIKDNDNFFEVVPKLYFALDVIFLDSTPPVNLSFLGEVT